MSTMLSPSPLQPAALARLFHHRWAVPVLAALSEAGGGARFAALANRLGVGRDSLKRTLAGLLEAGLVARNPGYGHPLRPEYVLTARGSRLAPACLDLLGELHRLGAEGVGLRKWSMAVVWAVEAAGGRFGRLREELPGITPRALALALKELRAARLLRRSVVDAWPPRVTYGLTDRARRLGPALQALAGNWCGCS